VHNSRWFLRLFDSDDDDEPPLASVKAVNASLKLLSFRRSEIPHLSTDFV